MVRISLPALAVLPPFFTTTVKSSPSPESQGAVALSVRDAGVTLTTCRSGTPIACTYSV